MQHIRFICFLLIAALAEASLPTALAPAIASEQAAEREINVTHLNAQRQGARERPDRLDQLHSLGSPPR